MRWMMEFTALNALAAVLLAIPVDDRPLGIKVPPEVAQSKPQANIDGDTKVDYLVKLKLSNVPADTLVFWDINPQPSEIYEGECDTTLVFTGPPGDYSVRARGVVDKKKFSYTRKVTITGGVKPPPVPPVPPVNTLSLVVSAGPDPLSVVFNATGLTKDTSTLEYGDGDLSVGQAFPIPHTYKEAGSYTATLTQKGIKATVQVTVAAPAPPEPVGQVSRFVVVEDTDKSQSWRGDILGSPVVQAAYQKLQGTKTDPVHRLISVHSTSTTAEVVKYIKLAEGRDLPWIWLLDKDGKVIQSLKVPQTPEAFAKLIQPPDSHEPRRMGNKIPPPGLALKYQWKRFGASPNVPIIPRSEWKEISLAAYLPAVKDQDGIGACNAFATVEAVEACRKQAGLKYVRLSPGYLYGNINDGVDEGSMLEDGLAWMTQNGTCETALVGDLDWRKGRQRPAAAVENAKNYKVLEAYLCPDFASMASALQQGFFIIEGLLWYDNFDTDRDGWLPARGSGGYGGHALCGYGLAYRNGTWGIRTRNSWSSSWGIAGNCVIPESLFGRDVGGFWAVRAITATPTDFSRLDLKRSFTPDVSFALAH